MNIQSINTVINNCPKSAQASAVKGIVSILTASQRKSLINYRINSNASAQGIVSAQGNGNRANRRAHVLRLGIGYNCRCGFWFRSESFRDVSDCIC